MLENNKIKSMNSAEISEVQWAGRSVLQMTRDVLFGNSKKWITSFVNFMTIADYTKVEQELLFLLHYASIGRTPKDIVARMPSGNVSDFQGEESELFFSNMKAGSIIWLKLFPIEIEKRGKIKRESLQRALNRLLKRNFILTSPVHASEKSYAIDYRSIDFYFHNAFEDGLLTRHILRHIRNGRLANRKQWISKIAKPIPVSLRDFSVRIQQDSAMITFRHNQN